MEKSKSNYVSVSLPKELLMEVDEIIIRNPKLGYSSRAQFVSDAIRNQLKIIVELLTELKKLTL